MANVSTNAASGRWCPVGEVYGEMRAPKQGAALSYKNHQKQKQGAKNFTLNLTRCFCSEASKFLSLKGLVPCQQSHHSLEVLLGADAWAAPDSGTRMVVGLQGSGFLAEICRFAPSSSWCGTADVICVSQLLAKKSNREISAQWLSHCAGCQTVYPCLNLLKCALCHIFITILIKNTFSFLFPFHHPMGQKSHALDLLWSRLTWVSGFLGKVWYATAGWQLSSRLMQIN